MATRTSSNRGDHDIVGWRREQLVRTGFSLPLAHLIAADGRYDLHALIELVESGCPPGLAIRILTPDDEADVA